MDLIERYLAAIRSQLPDGQKADVTAELRDVLMAQIEDREAELGRPLTRPELEAVLIAFGHPLVVAGRYRKFNQLIGPEVFPFYWFGLRVILGIVLAVQIILGAVLAITTGDVGGAIADTLGRLIPSLVATVGWVTVAFVAIEYAGAVKHLQKWGPSQLPHVIFKPRKSRGDAAMELAASLVFVAWWMGWVAWGQFPLGPHDVVLSAGPMREVMHWPVFWLAAAVVAVSALELVRPSWNRVTVLAALTVHLATLAMLAVYVSGGPIVEVSGTASPEQLERITWAINLGLRIGLGFGALGMLWEIVRDVRWLLRRRTADGGPALA